MSKLTTGRNKKPRPTQESRSPYMGEARVRIQSKKFKNQGAKAKNSPKDNSRPNQSRGISLADPLLTKNPTPKQKPKARGKMK